MKKYLIALMLIAFTIPSVTLAAWWNPFSWWGDKHEIENIQSPPTLETSQYQEPVAEEGEEEDTSEEPVIETTTDSTLQPLVDQLLAQIQKLVSENESLRAEIRKLREQKQEVISISAEKPREDKWCSDAKAAYHNIQNEIANLLEVDLEKEREKVYASFTNFCGTLCNSELAKIDAEFNTRKEVLEIKEKSIKEDVTYYCE